MVFEIPGASEFIAKIVRAASLIDFLERPWVLLLAIPIFLYLIIILPKEFVKLKEDEIVRKRRKITQWVMLVTRMLIALLLLIAIATPYVEQEKLIEGDPVLRVTIDNSASMDVLEPLQSGFIEELEKYVEVEARNFGTDTHSPVGDAILDALGPFESVLVVSDGQATGGTSMGDVALLASRMNSTIHALQLQPIVQDASVTITGPSKTMADAETEFTVNVKRLGMGSVTLEVFVDGKSIYNQPTGGDSVKLTRRLSQGWHKIEARIKESDHFSQNNVFYKVVKAVPQPRVLYYGSRPESPLLTLLRQVYDVEVVSAIPPKAGLGNVYALVVNDVHANDLNPSVNALSEWLSEGNGMVVIGGTNSYNLGKYRASLFETMLPVFIGKPEKREGDVNVVILIDISGSTQALFGQGATVDVAKSLAVQTYNDMKDGNRIGVVAFNQKTYLLSELSHKFEQSGVTDKIARLTSFGGTLIGGGIVKAVIMLSFVPGSKNIIIFSDGKTQQGAKAQEAAKYAANGGIRIYTVGVGPHTDDETMTQLADFTNGIYYRLEESSRLRIIFGEPEPERPEEEPGLVILNPNHFITSGIPNLPATITGRNDVAPKTTAQLLVTSSSGDPVLTTWRFGLGRIASLSTDDGTKWAGRLLAKPSSALLVRTVNWAIGEPDRKASSRIDVSDTRLGEPAQIIVVSEEVPRSSIVSLAKIDVNTYAGSIIPNSTGFQSILDAQFGVSYAREYESLGFATELDVAISLSGGQIFNQNQIKSIVDAVKSRARRSVVSREPLRWPFIVAAIVLLLVEIFIRRLLRKE